MSRPSLELVDWQVLWRAWHFDLRAYFDEDFGIYDIIVAIGPLQLWFRH